MLLAFRCSNHKSIKDMMTFSMMSSPDDTHEERLIRFDKYRVSRASVIYGGNGHGKSNFIDALAFMCKEVVNSYKSELDIPVEQHPHKSSKPGTPSEYDIQFVYAGMRYMYGFAVNDGKFLNEYLYHYPKGRQVKIFERDGMEIRRGDKYKNSFEIVMKNMLAENRLFLSCAGNFGDVSEVKNALRFFTKGIMIFDDKPSLLKMLFFSNEATTYSGYLKNIENNPIRKGTFIKLLQALGTGVKDIRVVKSENIDGKERKVGYGAFLPIPGMMIETKTGRIRLVYDRFETDLADEESKGIQKLFEMSWMLISAVENDTVLVFDELETSLHEQLVFTLVKLFQNYHGGQPQLVFSTHDTNLLDAGLFRRDQIWFVELDGDRATDLYSLAVVRNVRKFENLTRGYMAGRYGGIPLLNDKILRELEH